MLRKAVLAFSLVLGLHSIGSSFAADAQQAGKVWRIGYLGNIPTTTTNPEAARIWAAFRQALQDRGYVEGRNLLFEQRFAEGRPERLPALAAELVRLNVDVIVAFSTPGVQAAKEATATIPIVMVNVFDPVGQGIVGSLAHPGGNITGLASFDAELVPKQLELLKAAIPNVARVVMLACPNCRFSAAADLDAQWHKWVAAGQSLGMTLDLVALNRTEDLADARVAALKAHPDAMVLVSTQANFFLRKELADFALRNRLPTAATQREHAIAGSLMSYGSGLSDIFRKTAVYVDQILRGAKPGDLPVEQPTQFELVINLKTAKALGLAIPQSLLLRADEVIQ